MINNSKQNCIDDLCASLTRSSNLRRCLQSKFNHPRNGRAAETLDREAKPIDPMVSESTLPAS